MKLFGGHNNHNDEEKKTTAGKSGGTDSDYGVSYGEEPQESPEYFTAVVERQGNRRWMRIVVAILAVILALVLAAFAWLQIFSKPPEINVGGPTTHNPQTSGEPAPTEDPTAWMDEDAQAPEQISADNRRAGTYTFAVIGTDVVSGSTDTILVGMLDTVGGKLNIVSIPRDTLVNTGYNQKKINYIYPARVNNGQDGLVPLLDTLQDMMGYPVDCYALVDIEVCEDIVDAIGGVWYDVPVDMDWDAPDQDLSIHISAGYQKLNGEDAVKVMRFRYSNDGSNTYAGGDIDRINVQQDMLMTIAKQMLTLGNIPNMGKLIDIYTEQVETNVTTRNLFFFGQEFLKLDAEDITFATLPANYYGSLYTIGYCFPYINDWLEMINEKLNPFTVEITRANLDMLYSDGIDVYGTQGYIKGGIESFLYYTPPEMESDEPREETEDNIQVESE